MSFPVEKSEDRADMIFRIFHETLYWNDESGY